MLSLSVLQSDKLLGFVLLCFIMQLLDLVFVRSGF